MATKRTPNSKRKIQMPANFIDFVTSLIYGDMGTAELGTAPPAGTKNLLHWTVDNEPFTASNVALPGNQFLAHHLDYMLARYEAWRSKYFLPPVRSWNGTLAFPPGADNPPVPLPASLNGSAFPAFWTEVDLGNAVRGYYNVLRNYENLDHSPVGRMELDDEIKAPYSYRYWAFMKWVSDLRKRLLGQPVIHVHTVYDQDGTILSDKDFTDILYMVHHIWHTTGGIQWSTPTPFFKTGVGQQNRHKKEISRTQIGAEFFTFHRDHLEIFDRWLARTGQDKVQSINTCAHDIGTNPLRQPM
ncbi:MAG: hypothetical protein ACRDFQ_05195 [Anaerolineales bacterium]